MGFDRIEFAHAAAALTVMPRDPIKPLSKANATSVENSPAADAGTGAVRGQ